MAKNPASKSVSLAVESDDERLNRIDESLAALEEEQKRLSSNPDRLKWANRAYDFLYATQLDGFVPWRVKRMLRQEALKIGRKPERRITDAGPLPQLMQNHPAGPVLHDLKWFIKWCQKQENGNVEVGAPVGATEADTTKGQGSTGSPTDVKPKRKGKNINARMLETLGKNNESYGWSAQQWADALGCRKGTIGETKTWTVTLNGIKARMKVEAELKEDRKKRRSDGD